MEEKFTAKDQILHLLKRQGSQTVAALAQALQISPMAIRQHLQSLKSDRLITYQEERRSIGRPVKLWQLTAQATELFPDRHADLLVDLLRSMATVFGQAGIDRLIAERSRRQVELYNAKLDELTLNPAKQDAPNWQQRVAGLVQLRTQEGYMAEAIEQADGSMLLIENHCPICAAAQTCQQLCGAELAVFQAVLPNMAIERVEHMLQGDRRCAYRVCARNQASQSPIDGDGQALD